MNRGSGAIRMGASCALLFAALSLVVWRQSRALEELRMLDGARSERAVLHAERTQLQREIQRLESRTRVVLAGARLGLRVPGAAEIVILQEPAQDFAGDVAAEPSSRDPRVTATGWR